MEPFIVCLVPRCPSPKEVFGAGSEQIESRSAHSGSRSAHTASNSEETRDEDGCLITDQLDAPVIDSLDRLDVAFHLKLLMTTEMARSKSRLPPDILRDTDT